VEIVITWIGVGLQMTAKVFQHRFGMFSAPVGGESEPDGGFCQPPCARSSMAWTHNRAVFVLPLPGSSMGTGVSSVWSFDADKTISLMRSDQATPRPDRSSPPASSGRYRRPELPSSRPGDTAEDDDRTWRR